MTPAEIAAKKKKMGEIYDRAVVAAADAAHSHAIPVQGEGRMQVSAPKKPKVKLTPEQKKKRAARLKKVYDKAVEEVKTARHTNDVPKHVVKEEPEVIDWLNSSDLELADDNVPLTPE